MELAERGYRVAVLEANRIGWGASGRNGGQVTGSLSGEDGMRQKMVGVPGGDVDQFVWNLRWCGHQIIEQRVARYDIACDLAHGHLQVAYKPSHIAALQDDLSNAQARGMGDDVRWLDRSALHDLLETDLYHGALRNDYNLHLHPLNLCLGEARAAVGLGAAIFEDSPVVAIEHGSRPSVVTADGRVRADSVIIAGNAYHQLEQKNLGGRLFPAALGIVTTEPLGDDAAAAINPDNLAVYDTRFVLDYYRLTADKRLLFGGGANYSGRDTADVAAQLRPSLERTFPRLQGMAGIVINRIPQLGKLSDNVYYAQGYSGHGIATSHLVGEIMADAVCGTLEAFDAFASVKHWRVPLSDRLGNTLLATGCGTTSCSKSYAESAAGRGRARGPVTATSRTAAVAQERVVSIDSVIL